MSDLAEEDPEAVAYAVQAGEDLPEVAPEWRWLWRAWHRLGPDRHWQPGGMGSPRPCDIPWTAVASWAKHHGLGQEGLELLDHAVGAMDRVYEAWWGERAKRPEG